MSVVETVGVGLVIVFLAVAVIRLAAAPVKLMVQILINSALGLCSLWLLNLTTAVSGISLGLNLFNALVIGILGLPRLLMLVLLQWVLT